VRFSRPRKRYLVLLLLLLAVVLVGIGVASWNISGSGNGYAKATTASSITLADATAFTTADLYPGATGSLKLRVTNPNSFPIQVTTVSGNGTITSDKGSACDASTGVSFANQTGLALNVGAGATATLTVASSVSMSNASDNSCQGAVFTVPVTVTGISNA
jgi:hypothetical protein